MRDLGVSRVGTSNTVAILEECRKRLGLDHISLAGASASSAAY